MSVATALSRPYVGSILSRTVRLPRRQHAAWKTIWWMHLTEYATSPAREGCQAAPPGSASLVAPVPLTAPSLTAQIHRDLEATLDETAAVLAANPSTTGLGSTAAPSLLLDDSERACLAALESKLSELRARGESVGGVLVEFVRASDGRSLSPLFALELARWTRGHRLLLFEDAVLLGLRCGHPSASQLYASRLGPLVQCHWIAVGKVRSTASRTVSSCEHTPSHKHAHRLLSPQLFGFSGVIQNLNADHHGAYPVSAEMLNGYITCAIAPIEVVRCRLVLAAIARRNLCGNAASVGVRLRRRLRAHGLDVWGVGLAIWLAPHGEGGEKHDGMTTTAPHEDGGGAHGSIQNATIAHNRILPPLTLSNADVDDVVVRTGLHSHLPTLLNSALGRTRASVVPPWHKPREVIRWHAAAIAQWGSEPADVSMTPSAPLASDAVAGAEASDRSGLSPVLARGSTSTDELRAQATGTAPPARSSKVKVKVKRRAVVWGSGGGAG